MEENRNVPLKCSVCGNTNFEYDDVYGSIKEADLVRCSVCFKTYTKDELIQENMNLINNAAQDLAKELIEKEIKKINRRK